MGTCPSWLATRRPQEVPYISGSPSFNVLAQSRVEQDWLSIRFICFHKLFPATFATVKISSGVHLCVIPSLRVAQPVCGSHRAAQPLALCKAEYGGGGISAEIRGAGEARQGHLAPFRAGE